MRIVNSIIVAIAVETLCFFDSVLIGIKKAIDFIYKTAQKLSRLGITINIVCLYLLIVLLTVRFPIITLLLVALRLLTVNRNRFGAIKYNLQQVWGHNVHIEDHLPLHTPVQTYLGKGIITGYERPDEPNWQYIVEIEEPFYGGTGEHLINPDRVKPL